MEGFKSQKEERLRPTVLAYRHEVANHFPQREEFEKNALNVQFGGKADAEAKGEDAVWGFTPESLKIYMKEGTAAVVVSQVSESDKYSHGYNACTGIAALGIEKETAKHLSFLSHGDPSCLLGRGNVSSEDKEVIAAKLREKVVEMVRRCDPEKLNFEIVGGGAFNTVELWDMYEKSITYLGDLIEAETGKRPSVSFGPNTELGRSMEDSEDYRPLHAGKQNTDIYVDTKNLGITVVRPEQRNTRWNNHFVSPRNHEEWTKLRDSKQGAADGVLPLSHNDTESLELWLRDPEKWKKLYGKGQ